MLQPQPIPQELFETELQPQLLAVKSLILISSKGLIMLYTMWCGMSMFLFFKNKI